MTDYSVKRLALILSLEAELEAMKSENEQRLRNDQSLAYTEVAFMNLSERFKSLAYAPDEELYRLG